MKALSWSLVLALCMARFAEAEPSSTEASQPLATAEFVLAATGLSVATTGVALTAGVFVHSVPFLVEGRPNPWVTTSGLVLATALNAVVTHLTVPLVAQALLRSGDPSGVREQAWRASRWALLGGTAGIATFAVGSGLEQGSFGRGQGLMVAGAVVTLVALLAWDVVEAVQSGGAR